jgi:uncharacterized membrane protein YhhN
LGKPEITDYRSIVLASSATLGLLYGLGLLPTDTLAAAMISKGSCVGLLAVYAVLNRNFVLALALGFGTAGDVFLVGKSEAAFMFGLSAFLAGHLVYMWIIWPARIAWRDLPNMRRIAIGLIAALGVMQGWYLLPYIAGLEAPVVIYTAVLMAMTALAIASRYPLRLVGLGAVLFFLSDLVLGISFFSPDMNVPRGLNWSLYYPGQFLLAYGLARGVPKDEAL